MIASFKGTGTMDTLQEITGAGEPTRSVRAAPRTSEAPLTLATSEVIPFRTIQVFRVQDEEN